jgi:UDP-N-acetylmuramoyl-tripeptide--D-alanyl-D-alanine ligase
MTRGRFRYWLRQQLLRPAVRRLRPLLYVTAFVWRRLLFRTTFVAITGSLGKTTAKECLASILASAAPTFRTYRNQNDTGAVALNLLRVRPWHRFAVLEVATGEPNTMSRSARLVRPDAAVILTILRTHTTAFPSLKHHAAEKSVLLRALKPGGLALLNKDDSLVAAMAEKIENRTVFFGTAPDCDYRADQATGDWPGRLAFVVHSKSAAQAIETQLVGRHWAPSVLAALATADSFGVDLQRAAAVLKKVEPFPGRMQPVRVPSGAIVLRDDYNASADTVEAALRVLGRASATRRLLVTTDVSDFGTHRRWRLKYLAENAARTAEVVVFIGDDAAYGKRRAIEAGMLPENVHSFSSIRAAAEFLRRELRSGDLMLLKGRTTDHAARIFLAQLGPVGCWKEYCAKRMLCDICWELEITPEQFATASVVAPEPPHYERTFG